MFRSNCGYVISCWRFILPSISSCISLDFIFVLKIFREHGINELLFLSDNESGLGRAHLKDSKLHFIIFSLCSALYSANTLNQC